MRPRVERAPETTALIPATRCALAARPATRVGTAAARGEPAAARGGPSRSVPCSRRSGNNRPVWNGDPDLPAPPAPGSGRLRSASAGQGRAAAAARDRRDAYGRRKQPSETPAQIAPAARLYGLLIETNSSIQAGVAARPTLPNSQDDAFPTKKMREKKPQLSTYPAQLRRFFGCHSPSVAVPERGAAASAQLPPLRCRGAWPHPVPIGLRVASCWRDGKRVML